MNKIFAAYIFLVFSFLPNTNTTAQGFVAVDNIAELEQALVNKSKTINTIVSDFIQEKHLAFIDEKIVSKGKFWLKDVNSIRWEYSEPFKYIIVIHEGTFKSLDDKGRSTSYRVDANPVFKEVNDLIVKSARGDLIADENFKVEAFENASTYLLRLTPLDVNIKQVLNKTELYFDKDNLSVYKVVMTESDNDYTIISFINRKFNVPVQDDIFIID